MWCLLYKSKLWTIKMKFQLTVNKQNGTKCSIAIAQRKKKHFDEMHSTNPKGGQHSSRNEFVFHSQKMIAKLTQSDSMYSHSKWFNIHAEYKKYDATNMTLAKWVRDLIATIIMMINNTDYVKWPYVTQYGCSHAKKNPCSSISKAKKMPICLFTGDNLSIYCGVFN